MPSRGDEIASEYDLVVIGAGINGAGIARDGALRGLSVLLLDKGDIGSGTSSWSSRLIHGGLRYLEYGEIPLVFESLHERRRLRRIAPHLVRRLRLKIPVYENARRGLWLIRLGLIAYDLLSIGKSIPRHRMLSREEFLQQEPYIEEKGLIGGASYFDAQVTYAERLVLENAIAARNAEAVIRTYSPVIGITVRKGEICSVQFHDRVSDTELEVRARMVVNAAGPWVDQVLGTVNRSIAPLMGGTKGSHIIVGAFPGAPQDAFYVEAAADGRPFFIIPWNRQYLIGTTDIRYDGDPGEVAASIEEVRYLIEETNRVFPRAALSLRDVNYAYAGVRPLPRRASGPESAITRRHIIRKHGRQARGLVSIIGGKLTTYRNLAEQVVDFVVRASKFEAEKCVTRRRALPGGHSLEEARRRLSELPELSSAGRERLISVYGGRAIQVVELAETRAEWQSSMDRDRTVLAAEVVFAVREEMAVTLTDIVHRRMMVGLDADQGASLAEAIAGLAAGELRWSSAETQRQLKALKNYNDRLKPAFLSAGT
ncbi:MAG: glycerol-3-phosphate dehydrogenase [Gammaproteobacteria bacterium]|nr:glycerol-3-phosphate dehydrogenase [Gammaproteobacteria bacterium]MDH5213403.1 glycerol-3-phosphate dehydrogenase [Gammaproteobacteria bacterium]